MSTLPPVAPPSNAFEPPPPPNRIFVNRNLRMDCIRAIGFDMDYTLARYQKEHIEALAYNLTLEKLVKKGYPAALSAFKYDPHFVIRGLTVDKELGNILKLDRHNHPGRVYHGRRALGQQERRTLYRREKIRFVPPRFSLVDTLFSLPEVCVYADVVEYLENHIDSPIDFAQIFDDTRAAIDEAHRDDSLKSAIRADFKNYLDPDPLLARTLRKLRSSGKKLFLLTNSAWDYTHAVMSYLLADDASPQGHWPNYFDMVISSAQKPSFFMGASAFTDLREAGGPVGPQKPAAMWAHCAPCTQCQTSHAQLYEHGNLKSFESLIGFSGEEILYVGDHIYGDILRSKKTSLWRTAFVVEELEEEVATMVAKHDEVAQLEQLERQRQSLDNQLNIQRQLLTSLDKQRKHQPWAEAQIKEALAQREQSRTAIRAVVEQMDTLQTQLADTFNKTWGMVFKEDRENSRFGDQVGDYACIYTSRVTNFLNYSSYQYFRSPRDLLPHERDTF
jgi:HAD superfamily 5'-nucleotidase-like hydrolase